MMDLAEVPAFKVGGVTYMVQYKSDLVDNGVVVWGYIDYNKSKIYIDANLSEQVRAQTLIHEVTHALFHEAGLDEQCNDEALINPVGLMLYQVVNDNFK